MSFNLRYMMVSQVKNFENMKAGKMAIWSRLSCQYSKNTLMDLSPPPPPFLSTAQFMDSPLLHIQLGQQHEINVANTCFKAMNICSPMYLWYGPHKLKTKGKKDSLPQIRPKVQSSWLCEPSRNLNKLFLLGQ